MKSLAAQALAALDPAAAALHARAGGALDPAAAWLLANDPQAQGGEWDEKRIRSAARRAAGQRTFAGAWSGWSDQADDDPCDLLAAAQAAAGLTAAGLTAADLQADWESLDTLRHAEACRITRRRAQQIRAGRLAALEVQGVLF